MVLLHETAVAWVRVRLTRSMPATPWQESRDAFGERLRAACRNVNAEHNVANLCWEFPMRTQKLIDMTGDHLRK